MLEPVWEVSVSVYFKKYLQKYLQKYRKYCLEELVNLSNCQVIRVSEYKSDPLHRKINLGGLNVRACIKGLWLK